MVSGSTSGSVFPIRVRIHKIDNIIPDLDLDPDPNWAKILDQNPNSMYVDPPPLCYKTLSFFSALSKVTAAVGEIEISQFQSVTEFYAESEPRQHIIRNNIVENIRIYHKVCQKLFTRFLFDLKPSKFSF